jgi:hypothetical protein
MQAIAFETVAAEPTTGGFSKLTVLAVKGLVMNHYGACTACSLPEKACHW